MEGRSQDGPCVTIPTHPGVSRWNSQNLKARREAHPGTARPTTTLAVQPHDEALPLVTSLGPSPTAAGATSTWPLRGSTVLVLDGEERAALAVSRSLGSAGCEVYIGSPVTGSVAGGSRFVRGEALLPDPRTGGEAYARAVGHEAQRVGAGVVLPITEASALAILEHRQLLGNSVVPMGDLARFQAACDKPRVLATARELGILVPTQWVVDRVGEPAPSMERIPFPVVVKPARSLSGIEGSRRKVAVRHAREGSELDRVLADFRPDAYPLLIQERIQGPGVGVFLLRWKGSILAAFAHRRIREKPPSGGVSTCCESIPLTPGLLQQSVALLEALDWEGVAMVEYKRSCESESNYLMEVNPRFWGSLQLAIDAGVNFPTYLVQLALGRELSPMMNWKIGLRSRWLLGDFDHLIARLRRSPAELHLPDGSPGTLRSMAAILHPWRARQRNDVFRLTDPVPAVREAARWLRALW